MSVRAITPLLAPSRRPRLAALRSFRTFRDTHRGPCAVSAGPTDAASPAISRVAGVNLPQQDFAVTSARTPAPAEHAPHPGAPPTLPPRSKARSSKASADSRRNAPSAAPPSLGASTSRRHP